MTSGRKGKEPLADSSKSPAKAQSFSKEQLIYSKRFQDYRDLLEGLLEQGKSYTIEEAEKEIQQFLKGKVN